MHGAEILLKSKGLNAYLVGSEQGFYLFGEDLLEGRLVGRNWESCLDNLRTHPIAFEGTEVLRAEQTPGSDLNFKGETTGKMMAEREMNNGNDAGINTRMDMD